MTALREDASKANGFLRACLLKLGLAMSPKNTTLLALSKIHLSSVVPSGVTKIIEYLQDVITKRGSLNLIEDEYDTFSLEELSSVSMQELLNDLPSSDSGYRDNTFSEPEEKVKRIVLHHDEPPASKETPNFKHQLYYESIMHYSEEERLYDDVFGKYLLYGDVVTSTSTLLEK